MQTKKDDFFFLVNSYHSIKHYSYKHNPIFFLTRQQNKTTRMVSFLRVIVIFIYLRDAASHLNECSVNLKTENRLSSLFSFLCKYPVAKRSSQNWKCVIGKTNGLIRESETVTNAPWDNGYDMRLKQRTKEREEKEGFKISTED